MVILINYSSKTNNSVILTVEKIDVAPLSTACGLSSVGWGLKGAHNPVNSSVNWRFQKTD